MMSLLLRLPKLSFAFLLALLVGGCATGAYQARQGGDTQQPAAGSVSRSQSFDRAVEDRILALNPERITEQDVRTTLAVGPTPQLVLLHGGVYPVHLAMTSFAKFLIGMGYPEARIRHPGDGRYSHSPYENSEQQAGLIAWYYERDGLRPMLIGHSQGGIQAVKILHELAGTFGDQLHVWNPYTDAAENRVSIIDPLTGKERPVIGLSVSYASAVGAGGAALLLPNQWNMADRLRTIPNTVDDFTGFFIGVDLIAWTLPGDQGGQYHHNGSAQVRNVTLPAAYNHVVVPVTHQLARDAKMRDWLNDYTPGQPGKAEAIPDPSAPNALWAADVWYSIKKHWCLEAQHLIRTKRAAPAEH